MGSVIYSRTPRTDQKDHADDQDPALDEIRHHRQHSHRPRNALGARYAPQARIAEPARAQTTRNRRPLTVATPPHQIWALKPTARRSAETHPIGANFITN